MDFKETRCKLSCNSDDIDEETYPILTAEYYSRLNDKHRSSSRNNNSTTSRISETSPKSPVHCHDAGREVSLADMVARRKLIIASILCLFFMIAEAVGGTLAGSLAIMTDAAHLLTDFAGFMISLFSIWLATRPSTKKMSFGWHRAEVIGAVISVLLIWVVTGILLYVAIMRIVLNEYEIQESVMLITAAFGVAVNLIMGIALHGVGHGHSHRKDAEMVTHNDDAKENINVRAAFIHVVGDFLQSLGVLIAAYIIYYYPQYKIIDPICTFIFSVLVIITTIAILKDALMVLMEGIPKGLNYNIIWEALVSVSGVIRAHNLRIWALTTGRVALTVHLDVKEGADVQEVLKLASALLKSRFSIHETTIQIEQYSERLRDCSQCKDPQD